jgi:hypothetical protein
MQDTVYGSEVVGEIYIPTNSNTPMVCRKIIADYGEVHQADVFCYGDATGGARGTAKVDGSDWDLIRKHLLPVFGDRLRMRVPKENPPERVRVNSVNSRLCSSDGVRKLFIDRKCKYVRKDFEGVRVKEGTAGELDKDTDPKLTHISDAIGYREWKKYPIAGGKMTFAGGIA